MNNSNQKKGFKWGILIAVLIGIKLITSIAENIDYGFGIDDEDKVFRIISSTSTAKLDDEIIKYGQENGIDIEIEHYGDLEIVDILNEDSSTYDAVWISNSIWLYMLDNSYLVTDSKSIVINPVVMGIEKSQAEALGFINKDIKTSIEKMKNNDSFAYPFGHYNDNTIKALKENGIKLAFTINEGNVKRGANKYKLPRVRISSWTTINAYKKLVE